MSNQILKGDRYGSLYIIRLGEKQYGNCEDDETFGENTNTAQWLYTELKEYVDFVTSLVEMDEVKSGKFILPTHMVFQLEKLNHREIQKEVRILKEQEIVRDDLVEPFDIDVLGITLKFEHEGYE